jgi:hypothetical protein
MRAFLVIIFLFSFSIARAQDSLSLPVSVNFVNTDEAWKTPTAHGRYRITVYNSGWEHIQSTLKIEWLEEKESTHEVVVNSSVFINEINDESYSLNRPQFLEGLGQPTLRVTGTSTFTGKDKSWLVLLGEPGQYSVLKNNPDNKE